MMRFMDLVTVSNNTGVLLWKESGLFLYSILFTFYCVQGSPHAGKLGNLESHQRVLEKMFE